jgi:hypothetical protein
MRVCWVAMTVLLPFEPLASTVMRIMEKAYAKRTTKPEESRQKQTTPELTGFLNIHWPAWYVVVWRCLQYPLPLLPKGA